MNTSVTEQILSQAEKLCQQRSVRLTPQRLEVLRLMSEQNGAISAYDLLDQLRISEPQASRLLFIVRWIFYWSRVSFTVWNQPTAIWYAIILIIRSIRR